MNDHLTGATPDEATDIVLIRHGETAWNREQRIQGQLDIELSEIGLEQADRLAERVAAIDTAIGASALFTSDLERARRTAVPIGKALALPILMDSRLRERHYGVFQGCLRDQLQQLHPDMYARWQARDPMLDFETGESLLGFQARISSRLQALAERWIGRRIIVVCHGGVLDCAWRLAHGLSVQEPRTWPLLNTSVNVLRHQNGAWSVLEWGDASHLGQADDDLEPLGQAVTP